MRLDLDLHFELTLVHRFKYTDLVVGQNCIMTDVCQICDSVMLISHVQLEIFTALSEHRLVCLVSTEFGFRLGTE